MKRINYSIAAGILVLSSFSYAQTSEVFTYTGAPQNFTVPSCVSSITITASGASGSNGYSSTSPAGVGGNGAVVTGTYPVNSGDVLTIFVGGQGTLTVGGYNGGGVNLSNSSAGGGGATDIRLNGSALSNRILVAGGGGAGGNGGCFGATVSGGNGGPGGGNGIAGTNSSAGGGGFPGVGTTAGSFGAGCGPFQGQSGTNGLNGIGGNGGLGTSLCSTSPTSGGSGGGGFIGGGGGGAGAAGTTGCQFNDTGAGGGGAGGDCYVDPIMTSTTISVGGATAGNGEVTITYTVNPLPTIIQTIDDERCEAGNVNLSATPSSGTVNWYDAPTGGTLLSTGTSYSPAVTTTTTFYVEASVANGCVSDPRTLVTASVYFNQVGPTTTVSSCGDYTWNGTTYTASGNYDQILSTVNGCDSTISLSLTIDSVNTGITQTEINELMADQNGATYQWYDCATNQPIVGETNQTFVATQDGSYSVNVSLASCDEMSNCIDLLFAKIDESTLEKVSVYPNPTNGLITIDLNEVDPKNVRVYNAVGDEFFNFKATEKIVVLNLKENANGIYFIEIETTKGIVRQKIVKQ